MRLRALAPSVLLVLAALPVRAAEPSPLGAFIREAYTKHEHLVPMRDGTRLFTAVYVPKDAGPARRYPILLNRTPYSVAPYGVDAYPESLGPSATGYVDDGYIFVYQDVRGQHMSEGEFVNMRPHNPAKRGSEIDESSDTHDSIDWLLQHVQHHNGRVGQWGISYPGFYASMAAIDTHPALKAASPQAPIADWFIGDDFHHNGAFMVMDAFSFYSGFGKHRPEPTTQSAEGFHDWKTPDNYDFYLRAGALRNYADKFGMKAIPFWNDLMAHPDYDDWWKARNPRPHLKNIMPAVMTVGGLFDAEDCFGAWRVYEAIKKQNPATVSNRLVMGPWSHGGWARTTGERLGNVVFGKKTSDYYQKEIEFKFFEFYLKDNGAMDLPQATVFETGSNEWTSYDAWPPRLAHPAKYYFHEGGVLSKNPPPAADRLAPDKQMDEYLSDPAKPVPYTEDVHLARTREYMTDDQRFAARRPDVLVYQTEVLQEPATVTGTVTADLWVSVSTSDADFVVKLIDVFPDTLKGAENGVPLGGYQMLVRGEIMRGRYRNGFEKGLPLPAGTVTEVKYDLPDVAHTFLPGHKIMVQVQSSWFPLADRNPQQFVNIYQAGDGDFVPASIRVYHTPVSASCILLPILKK